MSPVQQRIVWPVHHRTASVDGREVFYREAGDPAAPHVVLLHGFPTSSLMFRRLMPRLADRFHMIAPDHLGFGLTDAPPQGEVDYSFELLTDVTEGLLAQLGIDRCAIYVQDYGAPIGWRLATRENVAVTAIVSQNGNAYEEGFVPGFWEGVWAYGEAPGPETEGAVRGALDFELIRWQYLNGEPDPTLADPEMIVHDVTMVGRPGNDAIQLRLFRDYPTNRDLYPRLHEWFRRTQVPLLAVWGKNDEIFGPDGARAFTRDLPDAEVQLIDGGHFALECHVDEIAASMRLFLERVLAVG